MTLNPNAEAMKRAGYDTETLANIEAGMAANLSPINMVAAQREEEERQRAKLQKERAALLELADKCLEGKYGPEGKELALDILDGSRGGRTDFNLNHLRTAIRRLR